MKHSPYIVEFDFGMNETVLIDADIPGNVNPKKGIITGLNVYRTGEKNYYILYIDNDGDTKNGWIDSERLSRCHDGTREQNNSQSSNKEVE